MKLKYLIPLAGVALVQHSMAAIVYITETDLANYTSTVILDNQNTAIQNTSSWQIDTNDQLSLNTTVRDGTSVEQYAMIVTGMVLLVGDELQVDLTHNGGSQDLGLYVGGTTPSFNVRNNYVAVYARNNGQIFSRGFDGLGEYPLAGGATPVLESLFIARTAADTYETGYYENGVRNIIVTRVSAANDADVVGFYADVRNTGVLGSLQIVPEPTTALLGLVGLAGLLRRRRR